MIESIAAAAIPADVFSNPWHHVILRSLQRAPRAETACYAGPGPVYGIYDPDMGFGYHNPEQRDLAAWAKTILDARLPMLAGEHHSHYALLQTMGEVIDDNDPVQVFCRYEAQDFVIHEGELPPQPESPLKLKRAEPADVDKLFQFYARSETMQARSRASLLHTITHHRLYYLQKLGKPVSAALTHCESPEAGLIGGVYTPAAFRGKGYGYLCMHALMRSLKADGLRPVLFYEKNNTAARALYRKLGFQAYGEWILIELTYQPKGEQPPA